MIVPNFWKPWCILLKLILLNLIYLFLYRLSHHMWKSKMLRNAIYTFSPSSDTRNRYVSSIFGYLNTIWSFSSKIMQTSILEGWSAPFEYFTRAVLSYVDKNNNSFHWLRRDLCWKTKWILKDLIKITHWPHTPRVLGSIRQ